MVTPHCSKPASYFCALLIGCGCCLPVFGQSSDPFGAGHPPGVVDPFVKSDTPPGKPITVSFQVIDQSGAPVSGARIGGMAIRNLVITDQQGKAVCPTTEAQILAVSKANRGRLQFAVFPPEPSMMPKAVGVFPADDVSARMSGASGPL